MEAVAHGGGRNWKRIVWRCVLGLVLVYVGFIIFMLVAASMGGGSQIGPIKRVSWCQAMDNCPANHIPVNRIPR